MDDAAGLLWVVNQNTLELHAFPWRTANPDSPSELVFDLDPGPGAGLVESARVALAVRDELARHGLRSFPKTSGALGLHVLVPLDGTSRFTAAKAFARAIADELARREPGLVVARSDRSLRGGRVLIDWLQNDPTRTTVVAYSLRAMSWPTVSTPVTWDEVEAAVRASDRRALVFLPADVLARLDGGGDPFAGLEDAARPLPSS